MKISLSRFVGLAMVVLGVLAITTQSAWANDGDEPSVKRAKARGPNAFESTSYKTEILIAHAAPLGLMWTLAIVGDEKGDGDYFTAFSLTLPPLILAPPVVHAWNGNWGRSAASFGINLVAAAPGWMIMWNLVLDPCEETGARCDDQILKKSATVHTVFSGLATLADVIMADTEPKPRVTSGAVVQPTLSPLDGGMLFGAQGVF